MFEHIYIEDAVAGHPLSRNILNKFQESTIIPCNRYTEIFNRKSQNFRLQKKNPALILAEKYANFILPAPRGYGIGSGRNYYFSHMLNCIYDCRYCFLQGMYRSANYVLFVNYEDFERAIHDTIDEHCGGKVNLFSGYDCDSLAFEPVTGFVEYFLPVIKRYSNALFELRTKSTQIRSLLSLEPLENTVVAYSFTPDEVARALEHKTPAPEKRINAMKNLQDRGWRLGLRFDPLIYSVNFREQYQTLFRDIFNVIEESSIHSVSLGSFRLPRKFFRTMRRLYPEEKLFSSPLEDASGMISYKKQLHDDMLGYCHDQLLQYIPPEKLFPCEEIP